MLNLQLAANTDYLYYFSYDQPTSASQLFRLGETGVPEILTIPGFNFDEVSAPGSVVLAAHDSVLMVFTRYQVNTNNWKTLHLSTNYGQTYTDIDLAQLGTEEMFNLLPRRQSVCKSLLFRRLRI